MSSRPLLLCAAASAAVIGAAVFAAEPAAKSPAQSGSKSAAPAAATPAVTTTNKHPWLTPIDESVKKLPMDSQPIAAEASRKMIQVPTDMEMELVAAEPLVKDPVAINWGPDGKVWVVEMADYPLGLDNKGKPGSRVRWLEDSDGDGKLDKSVVFADGLNFANSVMVWRKGVLVTCAPEIVYLEDTDGDGKADVRKTLYSGFDESNPQLRINGLRPGLDNWLYCANGLRTQSAIRSHLSEEKISSLSGRDFRIQPDTGRIDAQSGVTEFGRVMNDMGEWFGNDNSNPLWHFVLSDHYLRRNPHVAAPDVKIELATPRNMPIYPISKLQQRFNVDWMANRITSACGIEMYRDDLLFPRGAAQQGFSCEPVHNMVLRTVVEPDGVTYKGRRAETEQRSEFIASEDRWFRPVMVRTGPDGALWICDMYRYTVEHPQFMTEEWRSKLEIRAGEDHGRLYRLIPKGQKLPIATRLDKLSTTELVAQLESSNGWIRETAQTMLVWKADDAAVAPLEKLLKTSKNPYARLHALCTLDGLKALKESTLIEAMADAFGPVRSNAVRIAEAHADKPAVIDAAMKLADDSDAKVRLQLACSLGEWSGEKAGATLGRLAVTSSDDAYITAAVMSSALKHHAAVVGSVLKAGKASGAMLQNLLAMSGALGDRGATALLLERVLTPSSSGGYAAWQLEAFAGWLDTLPKQKTSLATLAKGDDALSKQVGRAGQMFAAARQAVTDSKRPDAERVAAGRLLAREAGKEMDDVQLAATLLTPQTPSGVQLAAVNAMGRVSKADHFGLLLGQWDTYGPDVRFAVTELLMRGTENTKKLLQRAAEGKLTGFSVDARKKTALLKSKDPEIAALAKKVLATSDEGRAKAVKALESVYTMKGDAKRGEAVFARACALCHRIGDVGKDIGPDLRSVTDRSPQFLLTAIVDPNADIDPKYYAYMASTTSNEVYMGVLTSETGNAITILGMDGTPRTILRSNLASLRSSGRSLMPEGLEMAMTPQELADLIRYLGYPE